MLRRRLPHTATLLLASLALALAAFAQQPPPVSDGAPAASVPAAPYRVGAIDITVYVVGRSREGNWIGVATRAVET